MKLHDSSVDDVSRIELSRDELLVEMGLGPVWHLRGTEPVVEDEDLEGAAAVASSVLTPVPEEIARVVPAMPATANTPVVPAPAREKPAAVPSPSVAGSPRPATPPSSSAADAVAAARALLSKSRAGSAPLAAAPPALRAAAPADDRGNESAGAWDDDMPPLSAYADGFIAEPDDDREPLPPDDVDSSATEPGQSPAARRAAEIAALDWPELEGRIRECRDCVLCQQRQQAVPGVGDKRPDWLFIGEGPGADEDAQGEPFVGQAGKLLDAMLAAIDLKRGDKVYIANAVKCRPPGNRTPAAEEIATCWPYLQRQIALLQPKLIVLLGRPAVSAVLGGEASIASLRGKRLDYQGTPVLVSYHPAYLLRNLPDKSKAWEDLCRARNWMRELQGR